MYTFLSWNVNGIRAIEKKDFVPWLLKTKPDILAVQETKAHPEQLSESVLHPPGYESFWSAAERKGYSGVAVYTKRAPQNVLYGFGTKEFDREGRILILEYEEFLLFNIYFPNGQMNAERLAFKINFYKAFVNCYRKWKKKKKAIIVCGDVNTAHHEIDLARPKQNETVSGFLPEERGWIDIFIKSGLVDTFRVFTKGGGHYTWWDLKSRARERDVGWRIDYFFVDDQSLAMVKSSFILSDVQGSDHCPIGITFKT